MIMTLGHWCTCTGSRTPGSMPRSVVHVDAAPAVTGLLLSPARHLAFFDTRDGTLYAGDTFTTTRGVATSSVVPLRYPMAGLATWNRGLGLDSARRLRDLDPARLACGHGPVIETPGPAVTRAIAAAARKVHSGSDGPLS